MSTTGRTPRTGERKLDTGQFLAAGVAVAAVAGVAGWVVYLVGQAFSDGEIRVPPNPGATGTEVLTGATVFRTGLLAGLIATALLWVLLLLVPQPTRFFGWIVSLLTIAAVLVPFTYHMTTPSKIWVALINLVIGLVVLTLLLGIVPKVMKPVPSEFRS